MKFDRRGNRKLTAGELEDQQKSKFTLEKRPATREQSETVKTYSQRIASRRPR